MKVTKKFLKARLKVFLNLKVLTIVLVLVLSYLFLFYTPGERTIIRDRTGQFLKKHLTPYKKTERLSRKVYLCNEGRAALVPVGKISSDFFGDAGPIFGEQTIPTYHVLSEDIVNYYIFGILIKSTSQEDEDIYKGNSNCYLEKDQIN